MADEPRTYAGWKAGLLIVLAVVVVFSVLNVVTNALRDEPRRTPGKVVTTVTPTG